MGSNDLWSPPDEPAQGVRKVLAGGVELTLPPRPVKGAFEKAMEGAREKMACKDARDQGYSGVVTKSAEWHRILGIPRRILKFSDAADLTGIFRKKGGTMKLHPVQSAALIEAHIANGLFGALSVGAGKTLVSLLMPEAMDSERTVIIVPPQLRDQLAREIKDVYGPHFNLPMDRIVRILAYSELSLAKNTDLLEQLQPDLIIADECFPPTTIIATSEGDMTISEIVEEGRDPMVLSSSPSGELSYKKVARRLKRPRNKTMIRVHHENGSFDCTEDHKIWTERGYVRAKKLQHGDNLRLLQERIESREEWLRNTYDLLKELRAKPELETGTTGQGKGSSPSFSRVDYVEVLELGRDGQRGHGDKLHPIVYDLEIEENHNYFADGILVSNCHNFRRASAARTKRFTRYMRDNPHCRFVGLSGTMTTRSIIDYAHLLELALRKNSPLPNNYKELQDWAGVIDVNPTRRVQEGVLRQLCKDGESIRQGFRNRLVQTQGVVATEESALGTSLLVTNLQPPVVPASIVDALEEVEKTWAYNGEEYADPLSLWRFRRQVSCGFYYRWIWPDGHPDEEWLEARATWKSAARDKVKLGRVGMDSEFLVMSAAERWRKSIEDHSKCQGELVGEDHSECTTTTQDIEDDDDAEDREVVTVTQCKVNPSAPSRCTGKGPEWTATSCDLYEHLPYCTGAEARIYGPDTILFECEEWIAWKKLKVRYNPTPPKEVVWISDWLVYDVVQKAQEARRKGHKVIIWYQNKPMGHQVAELSGFPHYGAGSDAGEAVEPIIICSIATQGTGKNLQFYDYNITISMVTNGKDFEQQAGRTHRPGQEADEVVFGYYDHTDALDGAMTSVVADAIYIQDSTGQRQKILYANGERIKAKKQALSLIQTRQNN